MNGRTLAVGLDGFEISIARKLAGDGLLPYFCLLFEQAATFDLDHGDARDTGLAWEHFSTGKHPDDYHRWSAVHFDPVTYRVWQEPTQQTSFTRQLPGRTLVFDLPYHRLAGADSGLAGLADWGAHDPGVQAHSVPPSLLEEVADRFGEYPAKEFIYGFTWPCAARTRQMAERLLLAARKRTEMALWLASERIPDWDTAIIVTSELHSAVEAMWHGWDESHPLHNHASAAPAREGIQQLYIETDRMLAALAERFPDARMVVFAMHGMGPNTADVPSMALLPELLYRLEASQQGLWPRKDWQVTGGFAMRSSEKNWSMAVNACLDLPEAAQPKERRNLLETFWRRLAGGADRMLPSVGSLSLSWMPSARYEPCWHRMTAFALPSFYDGQIRVNLAGREAAGSVAIADYHAVLDRLEHELSRLSDAATGLSMIARTSRPVAADPLAASPTQCDLKISWARNALAMDHPAAGRIGPVPFRRTGGHTGQHGFAALLNCGLESGNHGQTSSMDIMPTIASLAGMKAKPGDFTGRSLIATAQDAA
jgi:predicted AlkP superfamily phosphohydrolase/phosphomutase